MRTLLFLVLAVASCSLSARERPSQGDDAKRPYEMVWANRTKDAHTPVLPLTDATGWTVETTNAVATFTRVTDRLLFGDGVCRLTYRATGKDPSLFIKPPAPVGLTNSFDTISCWIFGNTTMYSRDRTPYTTIFAEFRDADGKPLTIRLIQVSHVEWHLAYRRLSSHDAARVKKGATFLGFRVTGGTNTEDRSLDFTSFCAFTETRGPLTFKPRAKRPNRAFPEAPAGVNTGHGLLPFPNARWGVTPPSLPDERLEVRLPTCAGNWDALAIRWDGSPWQSVAQGGGVWFDKGNWNLARRAETATSVTTNSAAPLDVTVRSKAGAAEVTTRFRLVGKSLVVDVATDATDVGEVRFGAWRAPEKATFVTVPYLTYAPWGGARRPGIVVTQLGGKPFFHLAMMDWTQSNASAPHGGQRREDGSIESNGGTCYRVKTDGARNIVRERFVYSFSPQVNEVLPTIPNPVSPWKHVTGTGVWRSYFPSVREKDAAYWRSVRARGLKHLIVTDHEVGWRDGDESFTFRTEPAPYKGGIKGQYDYARIMIDELGYVYGPYNNFTDFAPVNEYWHPDRVALFSDGNLQTGWYRCYAPKPAYAVEACEALTPINAKNFGVNTAYCDVHTSVTPWDRTDYDARVPGAATFASTFYAFGEIMLIQKNCWKGPVYSEGGCHYMYCGLTDGNYAQDMNYDLHAKPWLVDFDLLRLHPLCCNFGMGSPDMFYATTRAPTNAYEKIDRFLAATVAFGHPGFLLKEEAEQNRSYFMIQALAARYTQTDATEIRYLDKKGTAYTTEDALANEVYLRSQVTVRYADGTFVAANGSLTEVMKLPNGLVLPPSGYCGWTADGAVFVYSGLLDGHRVDYAQSPDYIYMDGRGVATTFPAGTATNVVIRLREKEVIPQPRLTWRDFAPRSHQ